MPGVATSASEDPSASLSGRSGYTTPSPPQGVFQTPPPPAKGGQVDFEAVFAAASVSLEEQQRVAKTIELLHGLPAGTDAAVKKSLVLKVQILSPAGLIVN